MNINKETNSKFDREGYDYSGYSILNWNKEGINKETKSKFDKEGYDINGYNLNGFNQENVNQETKTLYDTEGYNVIGFNKEGYNRRDFDKEGINKETKSKFDKEGYDVNGYNKYNIKNDYMKYFSITTDKFDNSSKIENIKIKKNKSLEDIYSDYTINMIELYKSYNSFTATDMEKILFKYKVESAPLELREKFLITKMSKIIWVDSMILTASNSKNIILNMKIYPDKAESSAKKIIILIDNNKTYTFTEVKTNKEYKKNIGNVYNITFDLGNKNSSLYQEILSAKQLDVKIDTDSTKYQQQLDEDELTSLKYTIFYFNNHIEKIKNTI